MYTLKDNGVISEITCGNNFEYILKDNTTFVNTDYKVLQSQNNGISLYGTDNSCFNRCTDVLY